MSKLGKVYVTGADGFIGSHLVEELLNQGNEVTALCIYNSLGNYGWLEKYSSNLPKKLNLILGDVRDPFFMESTTKGHDTVFHLASLIAIPYSYHAPQSYVETNISGTLNTMQAALKNRIQKVVHTSTSEVYGTAQFVPITEKHPLQGQSPYSASKIGADMIVESFHKSFSLNATTLRPFNTYGPRQSLRAVIPTIISQILSGESNVKLGSITPTRDFNFVSDTVNAFIALASAPNEAVCGKVFNAGSGREISIEETAKLIGKLLNKNLPVASEDKRVRPSLSEVERLVADSNSLTSTTGWKSLVSLEEGLTQTIEWVKSQKSYLEKAKSYRI